MHESQQQPTIIISRGSGGEAAPEQPSYRTGVPERATWHLGENTPPSFFPEHIPGGRVVGDGFVSGVVVPVSTDAHYYREDGMSFGVGADEGYLYIAQVRPATDEEAALILAAEQRRAHQRELAERTRRLVRWRYPGATDGIYTNPLTGPTPGTAVPVPQPPDHGLSYAPRDQLLIDRDAGLLWTLAHNGADGDDWSRSNWGSYIALAWPGNTEREQLARDLTEMYASAAEWERLGVQSEAAEALSDAGWTLPAYRDGVRTMHVVDLDDVDALLSRTPEQWKEAGWDLRFPTSYSREGRGWRAAEAVELVRNGMGHNRATAVRSLGHRTVQAALTARPPHVPDGATRLILAPGPSEKTSPYDPPVVTDSPEEMRAYLATHPDRWNGLVTVETGPRIRHASGGPKGWHLWDDEKITRGLWWPVGLESRPKGLSAAAAAAMGIVVALRRCEDTALWEPMLATTHHAKEPIDHTPGSPGGDGYAAYLEGHHFTLPSGTVTWWLCTTMAYAPGEGDEWNKCVTLHDSQAEAHQAADKRLAQMRRGDR